MEKEPITRKTLTMPVRIWQQIDRIRRQATPIPSASEVVRELVREALEARAKTMRR